jgi:hypothetical protein
VKFTDARFLLVATAGLKLKSFVVVSKVLFGVIRKFGQLKGKTDDQQSTTEITFTERERERERESGIVIQWKSLHRASAHKSKSHKRETFIF